MQKYLSALLLILINGFSTNAAAFEVSHLDEKFYIPSQSILIGDNGIFVNLNGYVETVDSLYRDQGGIYIVPKMDWICKCGAINWPGITKCHNCRRGPNDS